MRVQGSRPGDGSGTAPPSSLSAQEPRALLRHVWVQISLSPRVTRRPVGFPAQGAETVESRAVFR